MKDFSKEKRNLSVLPENEQILQPCPDRSMINKNKKIIEIIKKEIKKKNKHNKNS